MGWGGKGQLTSGLKPGGGAIKIHIFAILKDGLC